LNKFKRQKKARDSKKGTSSMDVVMATKVIPNDTHDSDITTTHCNVRLYL
jgi:hypothetical protein